MKCKIHSTLNAGHSWNVQAQDNEYAIIAAVELELRRNRMEYRTTIGTVQTWGPTSTF